MTTQMQAEPQPTDYAFHLPITTEADLELFLWLAFGVRIPKTQVCANHVAPWTAFCHAYFARSPICVWKGSRGLAGKTFTLSALTIAEAATLKADINILGGSGEQSKRVHEAEEKLWGFENAPRELLASEPSGQRTSLTWGNTITALMASQSSVRGPHPSRLRLDECLASGTMVLTPDGSVPIQTLRPGDAIYSWHNGAIVEGRVGGLLDRGIRETVRVRCADGAEFYATPEHPVLTERGWTPAESTTDATVLGVQSEHPSRSSGDADALHSMLSSADYEGRRQGVCVRSTEGGALGGMRDVLREQASESARILPRLRSEGQSGRREAVSRVPPQDHGRAQLGTMDRGGAHGQGQARESTGAGRAALADGNGREVESLSARGGLRGRSARRQDGDRGVRGVLARPAESDRARSAAREDVPCGGLSGDRAPLEGSAVLVHTTQVVAVEPGPRLHVWDLSVPEFHTFIAAGIVVHNCDEMDLKIFDAAMGQTMAKLDPRGAILVPAQTVISSTHQYPDGTMSVVLKRAAERGWPIFEWCFRETMTPHGWLLPSEVERKRHELSEAMWLVEVELGEPSAEGRAINTQAVEDTFSASLGTFLGKDGERIEIEPPQRNGRYAHGVDWAKEVDFTDIVTLRLDVTPARLVAFERMQHLEWPVMIDRLVKRVARFGGQVAHDATGIGNVVDGYLPDEWKRGEHPQVEGISFGNGRARHDLLSEYINAIEKREIIAPRIQSMYQEHKYVSVRDLFGGGHPPDSFVAGALAWRAAMSGVRVAPASVSAWGAATEEFTRASYWREG